jgi:two-component system, NarL family, response regulator
MRTVSAQGATTAWSLTVATAVVGDDAASRERASRLLADAGFLVGPQAASDAVALVVLLGHGADTLSKIQALREAHPDAHLLAVMPTDAGNDSLRRVLLAGAAGIVLDDDVERTLVPTLCATLVGQLTVPAVLRHQIAPRPLSHREKEILALVMLGMTNREIAGKLFIAETTVKTHLSSAFRKIDAHSRTEAVGLIQDPESGFGLGVLEVAKSITA